MMDRAGLSLRRRTTVAQQVPADLAEKQEIFLSYIIGKRIKYQYPPARIGNMDETPMTFDLPTATTVDTTGKKTITIKTTGHEKTSFTVVLGCMADGTKLPPVVIFKLKNRPAGQFPPGVFIRNNEKGWSNGDEMIWWIENVWRYRPGWFPLYFAIASLEVTYFLKPRWNLRKSEESSRARFLPRAYHGSCEEKVYGEEHGHRSHSRWMHVKVAAA